MSELEVKKLDPTLLPLVKRFYKQYYPSAKPKSDELILGGYLNGTLVSTVRFRTIEDSRLLTGMLVAKEHQNKGLGHNLLVFCQDDILQEGDFCFAYEHLNNFYHSHGFRTVEIEDLPNGLRNLFIRYLRSGKKLNAMKYFV
ncbi:GNAT family N-acetyltransferase [Vibrio penaeicida]|uniref:Acyltransferase n=1 Tax=Vibrio penaeicida TaxID=104609 RepID=A0AAV5NSH7_9VIBR|nr:GNAT family N-acetyltransferase [Vibrio penaeicida]RTZ24328.1 GNAT family N-acetyltransferase [Vibrio penaeicida]GLQ73178.1 acyltransferase [Vibrio penaeicida]